MKGGLDQQKIQDCLSALISEKCKTVDSAKLSQRILGDVKLLARLVESLGIVTQLNPEQESFDSVLKE